MFFNQIITLSRCDRLFYKSPFTILFSEKLLTSFRDARMSILKIAKDERRNTKNTRKTKNKKLSQSKKENNKRRTSTRPMNGYFNQNRETLFLEFP